MALFFFMPAETKTMTGKKACLLQVPVGHHTLTVSSVFYNFSYYLNLLYTPTKQKGEIPLSFYPSFSCIENINADKNGIPIKTNKIISIIINLNYD